MQVTKVSSMNFYGIKNKVSKGAKDIASSHVDFNLSAYSVPTGNMPVMSTAKEGLIKDAATAGYYPFGMPAGNRVTVLAKDAKKDTIHDYLSASMHIDK